MSGSQEKATVVQPVTGLLAASSFAVTIWWWLGGDVSVFTLDFRVWTRTMAVVHFCLAAR